MTNFQRLLYNSGVNIGVVSMLEILREGVFFVVWVSACQGIVGTTELVSCLYYDCKIVNTSILRFIYQNYMDSPTLCITLPYLKWLLAGCRSWCLGFDPRWGHMGFVVDKLTLWQGFSEYFGFHCQSSFHQVFRIHWECYRRAIVSILIASLKKVIPVTGHEDP
jgi:hypothetical protein